MTVTLNVLVLVSTLLSVPPRPNAVAPEPETTMEGEAVDVAVVSAIETDCDGGVVAGTTSLSESFRLGLPVTVNVPLGSRVPSDAVLR